MNEIFAKRDMSQAFGAKRAEASARPWLWSSFSAKALADSANQDLLISAEKVSQRYSSG